MDSTTRNIIIFIVVFFLLKFFLGGKVDKDADLSALIASGALLIDVRTPGEFSGGHVKGAINIPVGGIATGIQKKAKDKSKPIIVYCHSGARSGAAKKALLSAGYTNVINAGSFHRIRSILGH
jgi:rhodanese-related sulfurtransferase